METSNHTGFRNGNLFCFNCGKSLEMKLPQPVSVATEMMSKFQKDHADCEAKWIEPKPDMSKGMIDRIVWWAEHGEHGTSSKTIFSQLYFLRDSKQNLIVPISNIDKCEKAIIIAGEYRHPSDPDDFKRCCLLIRCVPEWKPELKRIARTSSVWANIVQNWDKLEAMLDEQMSTGKESGMYDYMKSLGC